jgi:heme-degrading monooxygenase HmoA
MKGDKKMIKIHIRRTVPEGKEEELKLLINQLRSVTMGTPGYIAGETLKRVDKPDESLVVTKWQSDFYWNQWLQSAERTQIQDKIDQLLGQETQYEIYEYD